MGDDPGFVAQVVEGQDDIVKADRQRRDAKFVEASWRNVFKLPRQIVSEQPQRPALKGWKAGNVRAVISAQPLTNEVKRAGRFGGTLDVIKGIAGQKGVAAESRIAPRAVQKCAVTLIRQP
jgi:hypothetical protein